MRDAFETLSLADLRALQLERMRATLDNAYRHNASYRVKFDAARVTPGDLKRLSDIARFPFTTKADLRASYPFGFFARPMTEIVRVHASSGTTGKPTVVGYTQRDIETWSALVLHGDPRVRGADGTPSPAHL